MQSAVPRPMFEQKPSMNGATNGIPTPTATPPPPAASTSDDENDAIPGKNGVQPPAKKESAVLPTFKADVPEGDSPKSLATEPTGAPAPEEELPEPATAKKDQEEDKEDTSAGREGDIYASKVLQCGYPFRYLAV